MNTNFSPHNPAINLNNNAAYKNLSGKISQGRQNNRKKEKEKSHEGPKKVEKPVIKIKLNDANDKYSEEFSEFKLRIVELEKSNEKLKLEKEKVAKELSGKVNIIERQKKTELENKKLIEGLQNEIKQLKEQLFKSKNQERH